jgi:hypothetical protein
MAEIAKHLKEVNKWWSTKLRRSLRIAVHDTNQQAGREVYRITIFGERTYFVGGNNSNLGIPPYCRWRLHNTNKDFNGTK